VSAFANVQRVSRFFFPGIDLNENISINYLERK
jgi:hypothetical protein